MRVYNLTDVSTPVLEQRGLVGQHIAALGRLVNPGEFIDIEDSPRSRADLQYLLQVGAVSIDALPPPYVMARQQAAASAGKLAANIGQRVELKETKTAGEPPPGPPAEGATALLERDDPTTHESDPPPEPPAPPPAPPPANAPKKKSGK